MKKKPNFLIIGAAKSGTTTLHAMLKKHPDIFLAEEKDFMFFNHDENYEEGFRWYKKYFKKYRNQKVIGDANSNYLFSKKAAERIKNDLGKDIKLLAIIRNPVERSFSEFLHQERYGYTSSKFEDYIKEGQRGIDHRGNSLYDTIIGRSLYSNHIQNYWEVFPKKNLKIVILEKLKKNPNEELNGICEFLDIDNLDLKNLTTANKAHTPRIKWIHILAMGPKRNIIRNIFRTLVPSFKMREKIREKILSVNANKVGKPSIPTEQEKILWETIFKEEKQKLESMLDIELNEWK